MIYTNNPVIKHKAGLLNLAEELSKAPKTCKIMDVSSNAFYHYQELLKDDNINSLINKSRRKPNTKNRVAQVLSEANFLKSYVVLGGSHIFIFLPS